VTFWQIFIREKMPNNSKTKVSHAFMTLIASCKKFSSAEIFSTSDTCWRSCKMCSHENFLIALENSFMILHLFHFPPAGKRKLFPRLCLLFLNENYMCILFACSFETTNFSVLKLSLRKFNGLKIQQKLFSHKQIRNFDYIIVSIISC
jgi:hypothetical protein